VVLLGRTGRSDGIGRSNLVAPGKGLQEIRPGRRSGEKKIDDQMASGGGSRLGRKQFSEGKWEIGGERTFRKTMEEEVEKGQKCLGPRRKSKQKGRLKTRSVRKPI